MLVVETLPTVVVLVASVIATITDIWRFKVYNILTMPLIVSGPIFYAIFYGYEGVTESLLGMLFGFGIFLVPYMLGGVGAGDVKFIGGLGSWLGLSTIVTVTVVGCLATGVYAIVLIITQKQFKSTWINLKILFYRLKAVCRLLRVEDEAGGLGNVQSMVKRDDRRRRLIPFSAMMTVGVFAAIVWKTWN